MMAEELFECGICHCIYRITARECPRCMASNQSGKRYRGGFYTREDVIANHGYITHNELYNIRYKLTHTAFVPLYIPCNERKSFQGKIIETGDTMCPGKRSHCYSCIRCDEKESRALDIDVSAGEIRVIS